MADQDFLKRLLRVVGGVTVPQAQARLIAHRYKVPWHLVPSLAADLTLEVSNLLERATREAGDTSGDYSDLYPWLEGIDDMFSRCQSPVEELFLAACDTDGSVFSWTRSFFFDLAGEDREEGTTNRCGYFYEPGGSKIDLYMQHKVAGCRVDFALNCGTKWVGVEIDGHDFHERTKEQAQRDKSRDRKIQAEGWSIIRFTGSEIWRSPSGCVQEAENLAWKLGQEQ